MVKQAVKLLILEEDPSVRATLAERLHRGGASLVLAGSVEAALDQLAREPVAAAFLGLYESAVALDAACRLRAAQPGLVLILATPAPSVEDVVEAMRAGVSDFLIHPADPDALAARLIPFSGPSGAADSGPTAIDPVSREILDLSHRVAVTDVTVLLCGESGVGKEVFARFLHARSPRSKGPFVAVNCAAIPESMLEAMLFGHERGAFTGAHEARAGKFELAQGGTLLLDEVSEMAPALQAKLLRVLQEREVERLGGRKAVSLDVRVLATTNRDLGQAVSEGTFREDLFYRINVFPIRIPALRERPGDILPLARRFIARHACGTIGPSLEPASEARLLDYPWPGNIRELDNVIQRALILCDGETIRTGDLRFSAARAGVVSGLPPSELSAEGPSDLRGDLTNHEERLILNALESGSRKLAAERLGISPRTLRYKLARMREAGISVPE